MRNKRGRSRILILAGVWVFAWSGVVGCSGSGGSDTPAVDPTAASLSPAPTPKSPAELSQAALDKAVKAGEPGCSAAVGRRGAVLWSGAAGVSDLRRQTPITDDTVFDIGSVSKQFTATAVLLLEQDGKLSVNDRLSRHLDGLPGWADQVTLAQLMHHTSGIPETEDILLKQGFKPQDRVTQKTLRKAIAEIKHLEFRPGERWAYGNPNYHLLADVVERRSGKPFATYLSTSIFVPLHLKMTVGYERPIAGKAISYKYDNLNRPQVADWRWDAYGSGSIQTTPTQLVVWADNYRSGIVGGAALQRDQLAGAVSTTLGQSNPSQSEVYGAGIIRLSDNRLFHGGTYGGFHTWFAISEDRATAVAVACNLYDINIESVAETLQAAWQ